MLSGFPVSYWILQYIYQKLFDYHPKLLAAPEISDTVSSGVPIIMGLFDISM